MIYIKGLTLQLTRPESDLRSQHVYLLKALTVSIFCALLVYAIFTGISLRNTSATDNLVDTLSTLIKEHNELTALDISKTSIGDAGVVRLCQVKSEFRPTWVHDCCAVDHNH